MDKKVVPGEGRASPGKLTYATELGVHNVYTYT